MNIIKQALKEALIKLQAVNALPANMANLDISVFDEPLMPVIKKLQSLYEDCAMALNGEWDKSDDGFEAMRDSIETLLGDDLPPENTEGETFE